MLDGKSYQPGTILGRPEPPSRECLSALAEVGVATASTSLPNAVLARQRLLDAHALTRVSGQGCIAGMAVTVWNPPGSNRMIFPGLLAARPGDVLVIDSDDETAQWGEVAATLAAARGLAGVIIGGVLRDAGPVSRIGPSTWAGRVYAGQGFRKELGLVNIPISIKGLLIRAGDIVVADEDGILALPAELAPEVVRAAQVKVAQEEIFLSAHRRGELAPQLAKMFELDQLDSGPNHPS